MPGAGYDIGASLAQSFSVPLTANTSTTINFGAGSSFFLPNSQSVTSEPVSVATTKSPGTTNEIGGTGSGQSNATSPQTGYAADLGLDGFAGAAQPGNNYVLYAIIALAVILLIDRK